MPMSPHIAIESTRLPDEPHGDLVDRILMATARAEGARLVTCDRSILDYAARGHLDRPRRSAVRGAAGSPETLLTGSMHVRVHVCMATKTISIDIEAYERLRRARRSRDESFSMVIKRATWPAPPHSAGALLAAFEKIPTLDEATLRRLEEAHDADRPPEDPWRDG